MCKQYCSSGIATLYKDMCLYLWGGGGGGGEGGGCILKWLSVPP